LLSSPICLLLITGTGASKDTPAQSSTLRVATPTRNGLKDLYLFAGTGVLDKATDVDNPLVAGVGALQAGVVRLYGVVVVLSG